ncbi:MAG: TIGR03960 family B12-binding radical SAM protein [Acidobacteria bacterium]|nr:TIGR03960 family B12-binding radical SAM protein [Acidobacteriota bacterium]
MERLTDSALEKLLVGIQKPGRYIGGEWNAVKKEKADARVALAFPDLYEVGMSHIGQQILYHILNGQPDIACERVFAPWIDFEKRLRESGTPLFSLESRIPLSRFDLIGFSLLYELNYTNVLTILDLGGVPLLSCDRGEETPFVIAGGPAAFNPEPVAGIFDCFVLGDGEEVFPDLVHHFIRRRKEKASKSKILEELARWEGIYVPALTETQVTGENEPLAVRRKDGAPLTVRKRVIASLSDVPFHDKMIVPNIEIVFDRAVIEVARGCPQNCRFCQATNIYFPPRIRDAENVVDTMRAAVRDSGFEDSSLAALSIGDYPHLKDVMSHLMDDFAADRISLSLSSLRPKNLSAEMTEQILRVRKTGLTLVPEAGTDRLRRVINKDMDRDDILNAAETAFTNGWRLLKLYFMIGLPSETREDLDGIVDLVQSIIRIGYDKLKKAPQINLSVSSFIPKPHTPFQWEAMDGEAVLREKRRYLFNRLSKYRFVRFKRHDIKNSILEGVFSRGDRRLNSVLLSAWKKGARFDGWNETFDFGIWEEAFRKENLDFSIFLHERDPGRPLPWDFIETGMTRGHLLRERDRAYLAETTPSCLETLCASCRGCCFSSIYRKTYPPPSIPESEAKKRHSSPADGEVRYLVVYSKTGMARFLGHRDMNRLLQRALRRADIPSSFSQGFHPKMLMTHPPALPLGMEGKRELFEFRSEYLFDLDSIRDGLNAVLPNGFQVIGIHPYSLKDKIFPDRLKGFDYSLDLFSGFPVPTLLSETSDSLSAGKLKNEILEKLEQAVPLYPGLIRIEASPDEKTRLLFSWQCEGDRAPRPQEMVENVLGIRHAVYAMARERIILDEEFSLDQNRQE